MPAELIQTALRLADEGVPLAAIARATKIPSSDLRERLLDAQLTGQLLEMPCTDWPRGVPRGQRPLQLSRQMTGHRDAANPILLARLFGLSPIEAKLLLAMLQNESMNKDRSDMSIKTVDVHVFYIRKRLAAFGIRIATVWGFGYRLEANHRRKVMDLMSCWSDEISNR